MAEDYGKLAETLIAGKIDEVKKLTEQALNSGADPKEVLNKGLMAGMEVVGQRFKACDMFIPEVLRSAKAMHSGMSVLKPKLAEHNAGSSGTMVLATVEGDLHDIGKNLVGMMFEGAGFEVHNLGFDIKPQAIVDACKEHKPEILGMSCLLTTTMPKMGETLNALKEAGIRDQITIMIGGAPVTQEFADEIGADYYSQSAVTAADKGKEILAEK